MVGAGQQEPDPSGDGAEAPDEQALWAKGVEDCVVGEALRALRMVIVGVVTHFDLGVIDQWREVHDPGLTRNRMHHTRVGRVGEHGHVPTRCHIAGARS